MPEGSLRERLIDVGVELVLTEGTASVGLREIARRAGVSHGAPRRYFSTHHALLSAIAARGFDDLGARFAEATADLSPPRARIEALAKVYVRFALERRGMFELMFRHDLLDSGQQVSGRPWLRAAALPLFERVVDLVARCRAVDSADPADPAGPADPAAAPAVPSPQAGSAPATPSPHAVTAAAIWTNLHGLAQLWGWGSLQLALGVPEASDDHLDRLVAAVMDAHLGPAAP
ncbi:TetR/AcrR family transcriptional regulator [Catenulispora yoronensis]|uniref:TetR/AcrR family transcriptional regulator n=1 Tax=Catenulispora yoronensis TaxID=450799 RepID=A0ABP5G1Z6_9ACTN